MIILKVTKKQCFALYLEDTLFDKPQEGVKLTSLSLFRVNQYCQYFNLPTFNQSSQSNQLFQDWLVRFFNLYIDYIGLLFFFILFNYKFWFTYVYLYKRIYYFVQLICPTIEVITEVVLSEVSKLIGSVMSKRQWDQRKRRDSKWIHY